MKTYWGFLSFNRDSCVGDDDVACMAIQSTPTKATAGYSKVDILALLATMSLMIALAVPVLARYPDQTKQFLCSNNLRLLGQGFLSWGVDYNQARPWWVEVERGGTKIPSGSRIGQVWSELSVLSNHLSSPRIFACPGDKETTRVARNFTAHAEGGLLHAEYQTNATSYFLGLDTFPKHPDTVLAGDRNFVAFQEVKQTCASGITNVMSIKSLFDSVSTLKWTNAIHGLKGNALRNDGSVRMADQFEFGRMWAVRLRNNWDVVHLLMPK